MPSNRSSYRCCSAGPRQDEMPSNRSCYICCSAGPRQDEMPSNQGSYLCCSAGPRQDEMPSNRSSYLRCSAGPRQDEMPSNEHVFPYWLDVMYQPRSSVCETRISLGLMINAPMLLASSRRLVFGGPVIALGLTGKSSSAVK